MFTKLYRLVSIVTAFVLAISTFTSVQAGTRTLTTAQFTFENRMLSINTGLMEMRIENGAINYIKDIASGELLLNSSSINNRPSATDGFIGFTSKAANGNYYYRNPVETSAVTFSLLQPNAGQLTYTVYRDGFLVSGSKLVYDITVDASGEILLQVTGLEGTTGYTPFSVDLPIVNSTAQSVILGSGAEYLRSDPAKNDRTTFIGLGLFSPTMAVIKNSKSVIAVWSETTSYQAENINLTHTPAYDHVVLHADADVSATNKQQIVSPRWRIGTYPTWYDAARRWKTMFEMRTGAKPLWQNSSTWVRNIHAVFNATNANYNIEPQKFAELAAVTDPHKTLYFEWNGDRIVLFGDPTLAKNNGRPSENEIKYVRQYGWPMILYHPYTLIYTENGAANRLKQFSTNDWLPSGYQFKPDYGGTSENWQAYWSDVKAVYNSDLYVLNPASDKFKTYLGKNFSDYCNQYGALGAYLDTLGSFDVASRFTPSKQVINGDSFVVGEMEAIAQTRAVYPELAIMSELASPWLIPHVFYTWEGTETFVRQNQYAQTKLNHPLRVALTGSYTWGQEDNSASIDDNISALLGTLPQVSLVGDWAISADRAKWSQARAKLFTEQELFNDIPPVWKDGILAYYRSKSGNWFAYKKTGSTYGYVEILADGSEVVRLSNDGTSSSLPTATSIVVSATSTATSTAIPTATRTPTIPPVTPKPTFTNTPLPVTATATVTMTQTQLPATSTPEPTFTSTQVPATATNTGTPVPTQLPATPTATLTEIVPSDVPTETLIPEPTTLPATFEPTTTAVDPIPSSMPTETTTPENIPTTAPTATEVLPSEKPTEANLVTPSPSPTQIVIEETQLPATSTSAPKQPSQTETKFDNDDPAFVYSPGWKDMFNRQAYKGKFKQTSQRNSEVKFTFTGDDFTILYTAGQFYGKVDLYIDGVKVDSFSQKAKRTLYKQAWEYQGKLTPGQHELRLVFTGPKNALASIDGITVYQP